MKAYQVFQGELDKHGRQRYDLIATYLDKQRAFDHAEKIANETPLHGDLLEFDGWYGDGKYASWSAVGLERVNVATLELIEITD